MSSGARPGYIVIGFELDDEAEMPFHDQMMRVKEQMTQAQHDSVIAVYVAVGVDGLLTLLGDFTNVRDEDVV